MFVSVLARVWEKPPMVVVAVQGAPVSLLPASSAAIYGSDEGSNKEMFG